MLWLYNTNPVGRDGVVGYLIHVCVSCPHWFDHCICRVLRLTADLQMHSRHLDANIEELALPTVFITDVFAIMQYVGCFLGGAFITTEPFVVARRARRTKQLQHTNDVLSFHFHSGDFVFTGATHYIKTTVGQHAARSVGGTIKKWRKQLSSCHDAAHVVCQYYSCVARRTHIPSNDVGRTLRQTPTAR